MSTSTARGQPQTEETDPVETGQQTSANDGVVSAALLGAILGGLTAGGLLYSQSYLPETVLHLTFVGSVVGLGTTPEAIGVWMGLSVAFGLLFAAFASPLITTYTSASMWLTARVAPLRKILNPLMKRSPLSVAAGGLGLLYGLILGVVVGFVGIPAAVGADVPIVNTDVLLAYTVFGLVFGVFYGLTLDGTIPLPSLSFISPRVRATVFAPLLAGGISGAIIAGVQPVYLRFVASLGGYGTLAPGFGVWMGLTFALGVIFAVVAGGHATRGNGTTGYGFAYGVVLAVFVGLLAIPAAVTASTIYELGFEHVSAGTLGAFVVYGLVLGSTFGKMINRRPLRPAFLVGRGRTTVGSSVIAGAVSGGLLLSAAPLYLQQLAGLVGSPGSPNTGFGIWLGLAILLGCGFAAFPARRIERPDTPGYTGIKVGTLYGILTAVVVGMFVLPPVIASSTPFAPDTPFVDPIVIGAYTAFGLVLGVTYGAVAGSSRVTPTFLQGRGIPVLGGTVVGGAAGAVVANSQTTGGVYFITLGTIVNTPSLEAGLAVWFGLSLLLGLFFIPLAARAVETRVGVPRGLGVGLVYGAILTGVVGVFLVPAIVRAGNIGLALPHTESVVAGYFIFGTVFGATYGHLRKKSLIDEDVPTSTAIGTPGQRAIVFGSLFGGAVGGLVVHHMVGPVAMRFLGALVGRGGSMQVGWGVWLGLSLIFGMTFAVAVGPRLSRYATSMDEVAERDADLDAILGDFLDRAPVTTTATIAGFVYGIVLAIAVGAIGIPLAVNTMTEFGMFVPELEPFYLLAFVVYGLVMGLGYGVVKEF